MIAATLILAPATILGLRAFATGWSEMADKSRPRTALLNKAQGLGR